MKLSDHISEDVVCMDIKSSVKDESIREVAELLTASQYVKDFDTYLQDVFGREQLGTTGIGAGVAIPHARTDAVSDFVIAIGRSFSGIDFAAVDNAAVNLVILMGTPPRQAGDYLKVLARLCYMLKRKGFVDSIMQAPSKQAVVELFRSNECE